VLANQERIGDFDESCANFQTGVLSIGDIKSCDVGDKSQRKILFFGDSHLQQLYPAIKKIFNSPGFRDRSVVTAFAPACLPDEHINNRTANGYHCDSFAKFAMLRAREDDIDSWDSVHGGRTRKTIPFAWRTTKNA
jgi:SGNH domain (fused to AT3 domains)